MRVLWSVNTLSPEVAKIFSVKTFHAISWVDAMSQKLKLESDIILAIAAPNGSKGKKIEKKEINGITYYVLPRDNTSANCWMQVVDDFKPDVIHAYGTEKKHNIGLIDSVQTKVPVIISLQGIIGEYSKYYYAGLSLSEIVFNYTIGDVLLRNGIINKKKNFIKQAELEKTIISRVNYVEGRSDWDRVYSKRINRNLKYYYCPRMIREPFYHYRWDYDNCQKHSILVHQATYPIKGLHMALDALAMIKEVFPDTIMYIAGQMNFTPKTIKEKLLYSGYTKYIKKKIHSLELEDNIQFTGYLSADQMAAKLCDVQVCVIPSSIENAPNAIAEAMLVGTPLVSSYVGGSPDMLNEGQCGLLYRFDEPEMMAYRIEQYFNDKNLCEEKSRNAVLVSQDRHDPATLIQRIKSIYQDVVNDFKNCGGNR